MAKRYRVTLEAPEREELQAMISRGKASARKLADARVQLLADQADGGPGRTPCRRPRKRAPVAIAPRRHEPIGGNRSRTNEPRP